MTKIWTPEARAAFAKRMAKYRKIAGYAKGRKRAAVLEYERAQVSRAKNPTLPEGHVNAGALIGQRVQIPVHYDMWMRGAKYGVVTGYRNGRAGQSDYLLVKMDNASVKKNLKLWRPDWNYAEFMGRPRAENPKRDKSPFSKRDSSVSYNRAKMRAVLPPGLYERMIAEHKLSRHRARARSKNPPGYIVRAQKGGGPVMHWTGVGFSNTKKPLVFSSLHTAGKAGRDVLAAYHRALNGYTIWATARDNKDIPL
jgi:hypothetical protein